METAPARANAPLDSAAKPYVNTIANRLAALSAKTYGLRTQEVPTWLAKSRTWHSKSLRPVLHIHRYATYVCACAYMGKCQATACPSLTTPPQASRDTGPGGPR